MKKGRAPVCTLPYTTILSNFYSNIMARTKYAGAPQDNDDTLWFTTPRGRRQRSQRTKDTSASSAPALPLPCDPHRECVCARSLPALACTVDGTGGATSDHVSGSVPRALAVVESIPTRLFASSASADALDTACIACGDTCIRC